MPTLNLAYIAELILKYARKFAYGLFLASFWLAIAGMWTSFVTAFLFFYDKLNIFLNTVSSGGAGASSDYISMMFGVLNCIGFISAYNDTKAVFISAITFLFARILFSVTLKAYYYYIDSAKPLVN